MDFLKATGGTVSTEFVEVQSGGDNGRPKLAEALKLCKLTRSTLLIAKLDRLSRDAAFLLTLQNAGTRFVAVDNPDCNETVVGILAVIAQAERKAISERTKSALAAAKRRGVRLGNPRLQPGTAATALAASRAASEAAKARAEELRELIDDARSKGCATLRAIAEHLNGLGISTPRGGCWGPAAISRLLTHLDTCIGAERAAS
jgi:DNA invertase Pin-like site-specific DNA recombinase